MIYAKVCPNCGYDCIGGWCGRCRESLPAKIEVQSTPPGFSSYAEWREWLAASIAAEDEIKNHYFNDADS